MPISGGGKEISILHVDDEPDFADMAAEFLEREDEQFRVETATGAVEGLNHIGEDGIDCIVSDYDMPDRNGIELLEAVREDHPDLPFILFTGKGSEEIASDAISAGVTDYLQKGTGTEQYTVLANRIRNAVESYRAQRSRQRQIDAIETAQEGISILNEEGRFIYVNEAYAGLHGYDSEEIVGEHWELLYRDDEVARLRAEILPEVEETGYWRGTTNGLRADGSVFVKDHVLATTDRGELICVARDITDRKERERELERYERIVETIDDVAFVVGDDWTVEYVSEAIREYADVPPDELEGCEVTALAEEFVADPDEVARFEDVLAALFEREEPSDSPKRLELTLDVGEVMTFEYQFSQLVESESVEAIVITMRDITGRKEYERELEQYQQLVNAMEDSVCIYDEEGRYELVNQQIVDGYETPPEGLLGSSSPLVERIRREREGDIYRELLDGDRDEIRVESESVFPGKQDIYEHRLTRLEIDGQCEGVVAVSRNVADRKERERELEILRDRLEFVLEVIDSHIWATEVESDESKIYGATEPMYGKPVEEVRHTDEFYEGIHPDDRERVKQAFDEVWSGRQDSFEIEFRTTPDRGEARWMASQARYREEYDADRLVGLTTDVTDRKRRERELERTNTLLSSLFDTLPQGVLVEDESRDVLAANRRLFDLFEFPGSLEELTDEDCEQLAEKASRLFDDPEQFVERINERITERDPVDDEEIALADGRTYQRSYRPIALSDGDGHLWIYDDITEQVDHRERIRELQLRTQQLIASHTEAEIATAAVEIAEETLGFPLSGVHLIDDDGERLDPVAVTDAVRDHLDGEPVYERTHPSRSVDTFNWEVFDRGELVVVEDIHDHERISPEATPFRSGIIYPLGDHGLFITSSPETNAFDENDVNLVEILGTIVTAALDRVKREAELREQKRRFQKKTERLDEFASIVSHDLRNPLTVAEGKLELAREECGSEYLDGVARALDRMDTLITDLLTLAREGERVDEIAPVALADASEGCWRNVETADATLLVETDQTIRADPNRLKQLLENLIRNAVEHGGEDVTVAVGALDDGSGFYVADDGPGIPADQREAVFDAGYSTSEEGTGFGLAIVRQIADAHDWAIRVTKADGGGGARFEFTDIETAE